MKEKYGNEIPTWLQKLGAWRINRDSIDFKWGYFAPRRGFEFKLHKGSYFDRQWAISICPFWGKWFIHLPFDSGIESCSSPEYGIAIHNNTFWLYLGGEMEEGWNQCNSNWKTWELPWFSWEFEFHHFKAPNGTWIEGGWTNREKASIEEYEYDYTLNNGTTQKRMASICEQERQWYRKWFPWVKKNIRSIDVEFSDEVGEETGSWKGGVIGCSYNMLPNETPLQTLRRMEKEVTF